MVKKAVYQVQSEQLSDMIKETVREAMQGVPAAPTDSSSFTEETVGDEKNYFQKDIWQFYRKYYLLFGVFYWQLVLVFFHAGGSDF